MVSEILGFLFNNWGGAWLQGVPGWCHWMCLSIRNKYMVKGWRYEGFLKY